MAVPLRLSIITARQEVGNKYIVSHGLMLFFIGRPNGLPGYKTENLNSVQYCSPSLNRLSVFYLHTLIASMHQPSLLYSGGQSVSSGMHVSPPSQMDTGGYLPPFLLGSPAAKSVSCRELFIPLEILIMFLHVHVCCVLHILIVMTELVACISFLPSSLSLSLSLSLCLPLYPFILSPTMLPHAFSSSQTLLFFSALSPSRW